MHMALKVCATCHSMKQSQAQKQKVGLFTFALLVSLACLTFKIVYVGLVLSLGIIARM